jgi:putative glycerol-1-phosphate prenyltransferase
MESVHSYMLDLKETRGTGYVVLLDPDRCPPEDLGLQADVISKYADLIFVGGSLCVRHDFEEAVKHIKAASAVPVVIFPGDSTQVSQYADALLFLSLVSGRNPDLLIGEHVKAAPRIHRCGLETIPVAYILVESGETTSVQFISQSLAIPPAKPELAVAHALAGEYLGMRMVFLEAGSGARHHVPAEMVRAVAGCVSVPVIVGGGIKTPDEARSLADAGASFIVTGDVIEKKGGMELLRDFTAAIHSA